MSELNINKLRLPVLMYHTIYTDKKIPFSINVDVLTAQFKFLIQSGFTPIFISDLLNYFKMGTPLPRQPIIITFDDGYKTIETILYPILVELSLKASVFLIPSFIDNDTSNLYLSIEDIKKMNTNYIEWGVHSYNHFSFKKISVSAAKEDIEKCFTWFTTHHIFVAPAFAFPYGAFPKFNLYKRTRLFATLSSAGIELFFRIGNRMNFLGKKNILLQRIDITGDETIEIFKQYLIKGKR